MSSGSVGFWLAVFAFEAGRYFAIFGGAYWLLVHKDLGGGRKIQARAPAPDQVRREIALSLRTLCTDTAIAGATYLAAEAGLLRLPSTVAERGWLHWGASIVLILILHDTYFYFTHRLMHHRLLFRRIHATHHQFVAPTPFAGFAFSPVEAIVQKAALPLLVLLVPAHFTVHIVSGTLSNLFNAFGHSGRELTRNDALGRFQKRHMTTTTHHELHHMDVRGNYSLYLIFWDRLVGTMNPRYQTMLKSLLDEPKDIPAAPAAPPLQGT